MLGHFVFLFFPKEYALNYSILDIKHKYCLSASEDLVFLSEVALEVEVKVRRERR